MNMESSAAKYQGAQGVPEELVKELEKQFGFDKPVHERFLKMAADYARFDFGRSYYKDKTVGQLIVERLPVSVSLGLWSTLIIYLIAIPLGIKKAVRDGSKFDVWSSFAVILGSAIPVFLDEINKQYVLTARAKGLSENQVLYGHVFRNAMLIVIAGMPAMLIKMLFTGSLLIEVIFSLNGLGLLGYEAIMTRDYPVIFGTLYIFALLGLLLKLISDLTYSLVDPRITFDKL